MEFPRLTDEQYESIINDLMTIAADIEPDKAKKMKHCIRLLEMDRMARDTEYEVIKELSFSN